MYVEDKTLNIFMLADGEKIEKSCTDTDWNKFVIFTNKRILSGIWFEGFPHFKSIPYSAIIYWNIKCDENSTSIELILPDEYDYRYCFEMKLGGEIDSLLVKHTIKIEGENK